MGKSTAVTCLLNLMKNRFKLVVAFVGSAACNPELERMMAENWDSRFFFPGWDHQLVERLLEQQEKLKKAGVERQVLILMDDVILDRHADDALAHMGMRGRHFNISCVTCSVSYTTLPKRFRRSLDCLLVYSLPMTGDLQVLTWEFTQRAQMARWALGNLEEHQCLVLETLQRRQALFVWRASLGTSECSASEEPENSEVPSEPGPEGAARPEQTSGADSNQTISGEPAPTSEACCGSEAGAPDLPG